MQRITIYLILIALTIWNVGQCSHIDALENEIAKKGTNDTQDMLTMSMQIHRLADNQHHFAEKIEYMIRMYDSVKNMREEMLRKHTAIMEAQMCVEPTDKRSSP